SIGMQALNISLGASILLFLYSAVLKKTLLIGNFVVSLLVGLTFVYGGVISGYYIPALILGVLALFSNMGREIFKSIDDMEGDRKHNVRSLPLRIGEKPAKTVASIFILFAIALSALPYIAGIFNVAYMFSVFIVDILFIAMLFRKDGQTKLCKVIMLFALIAFLIGALVK
ncbi:MAG: UbiA family prenyltransferase, partial [Candidatus Aenigmarchaeota archaeon]|nr:UbiA family prenyltransferase [Candidatus Aenigmarchaeota archaeon]MDI6722177.1 UbiA family prenyltransferase [Candidatus Aenigmarchaeota archaeon]